MAVYSDPDAQSAHASEADLGVPLPGATPAETYLRGDLIIAAAKAAGADAIHPGYGFLSENADFAQAVMDAGLTWIGPPPEAMRAMASKVEARRLVSAIGVPILEGTERYPLIIKASAGGGGRGMRIVRTPQELPAALEQAQAEAQSAFGDGAVFTEPYLESAHHIEVQILADTHGTIWALGERECSLQRRHQKVIEETPSPLVEQTPGLRARLFEAAIAAAKAVSYTGAGTVEFLVQGDGFYFLEMNTRLQVEHPVTEAVFDLDLVAWQLDIANGEALPVNPPSPTGHAIEARLYAEDAAFTPQTGLLHRFEVTGPVRVDSGYRSGDAVSVHYDAMLAKVIAYAPSRATAAAKLAGVLERARLHGVPTNRDLLVQTLRHPTFLAGKADTAFLEANPGVAPSLDLLLLAAALSRPVGWRNVRSQPVTHRFDAGDVTFQLSRTGPQLDHGATLVSSGPTAVVLEVGGVHHRFDVSTYGDLVCVDSVRGSATLQRLPRFIDPSAEAAPGTLCAPMPGMVTEVLVAVGDKVEAGQPLLRLEAMKMQHTVQAPTAGVVNELSVGKGQQVDSGAPLVTVSEES
ncbi:acetyl/propionyl-CoA carboxylase subuit alpha [Rhizocola hellebori]|uniref:Acetyl/propionyl-CoA carboxylase subuit alpha n=1 Tax=Rhizocola hellebori TaxID=1392758 RepID=A0A8J3QDG6_9ACTN|nr:acetyl/propionyl-CoA carboxylase subuit alpha [Rhizocola hellebori]